MNKSIKITLSLTFIVSSFTLSSMEEKELAFSIFSNIEPFNYTFNITSKDNKTPVLLEFKNQKNYTINLSSKCFPLTIIAQNNSTKKMIEYTVYKPTESSVISVEAFESIKTANEIGFRVWTNK